MTDEVKVEYGLKEILTRMDERITSGFEEMRNLLADKASRRDLDALSDRVNGLAKDHDRRIKRLEDQERADAIADKTTDRLATRWKERIGIVGGALGLAATVAYTIFYITQGH